MCINTGTSLVVNVPMGTFKWTLDESGTFYLKLKTSHNWLLVGELEILPLNLRFTHTFNECSTRFCYKYDITELSKCLSYFFLQLTSYLNSNGFYEVITTEQLANAEGTDKLLKRINENNIWKRNTGVKPYGKRAHIKLMNKEKGVYGVLHNQRINDWDWSLEINVCIVSYTVVK